MNDDKILYRVLCNINSEYLYKIAPSKEYVNSLHELGLVNLGWDNTLTELGKYIKNCLDQKINKW